MPAFTQECYRALLAQLGFGPRLIEAFFQRPCNFTAVEMIKSRDDCLQVMGSYRSLHLYPPGSPSRDWVLIDPHAGHQLLRCLSDNPKAPCTDDELWSTSASASSREELFLGMLRYAYRSEPGITADEQSATDMSTAGSTLADNGTSTSTAAHSDDGGRMIKKQRLLPPPLFADNFTAYATPALANKADRYLEYNLRTHTVRNRSGFGRRFPGQGPVVYTKCGPRWLSELTSAEKTAYRRIRNGTITAQNGISAEATTDPQSGTDRCNLILHNPPSKLDDLASVPSRPNARSKFPPPSKRRGRVEEPQSVTPYDTEHDAETDAAIEACIVTTASSPRHTTSANEHTTPSFQGQDQGGAIEEDLRALLTRHFVHGFGAAIQACTSPEEHELSTEASNEKDQPPVVTRQLRSAKQVDVGEAEVEAQVEAQSGATLPSGPAHNTRNRKRTLSNDQNPKAVPALDFEPAGVLTRLQQAKLEVANASKSTLLAEPAFDDADETPNPVSPSSCAEDETTKSVSPLSFAEIEVGAEELSTTDVGQETDVSMADSAAEAEKDDGKFPTPQLVEDCLTRGAKGLQPHDAGDSGQGARSSTGDLKVIRINDSQCRVMHYDIDMDTIPASNAVKLAPKSPAVANGTTPAPLEQHTTIAISSPIGSVHGTDIRPTSLRAVLSSTIGSRDDAADAESPAHLPDLVYDEYDRAHGSPSQASIVQPSEGEDKAPSVGDHAEPLTDTALDEAGDGPSSDTLADLILPDLCFPSTTIDVSSTHRSLDLPPSSLPSSHATASSPPQPAASCQQIESRISGPTRSGSTPASAPPASRSPTPSSDSGASLESSPIPTEPLLVRAQPTVPRRRPITTPEPTPAYTPARSGKSVKSDPTSAHALRFPALLRTDAAAATVVQHEDDPPPPSPCSVRSASSASSIQSVIVVRSASRPTTARPAPTTPSAPWPSPRARAPAAPSAFKRNDRCGASAAAAIEIPSSDEEAGEAPRPAGRRVLPWARAGAGAGAGSGSWAEEAVGNRRRRLVSAGNRAVRRERSPSL